jgi:hypothetical protein
MHTRHLTAIVFVVALCAGAFGQDASPPPAAGQNPPQGPGSGRQGRGGGWGAMGEGRGILGTVTAVAPDHYTVKTDTGDVYTVHFSVNTRIVKAAERQRGQGQGGGGGTPPQTLKPSDIKVGDAITAGGDVDQAAKSVGAVFIALIDPERAKQMREMEANFGKTWLMGKVTAVDGVKVTLQGGPGNAAHSFIADDNTTFRKRRDPITLADVQVGDSVRVEGAVKDGAFVAASVVVMGMQGAPPAGAPGSIQPN